MNARVATATRLGFREQARRPLLLVLLVVLPFFFITRAIARTEPTPRLIGLPGGGEVLTTMKDVHGASMVTITVAFLAALCGAFIMRSAQSADRRLIVAGFRPIEAVLPRLAVLASRDRRRVDGVARGHRAELHAGVVAGVHRRQPARRPDLRLHRRARRRCARPARRHLPRAVPGHARHRHPAEPDVRRRHARRTRLRVPRLRRRAASSSTARSRRGFHAWANSRSPSAG